MGHYLLAIEEEIPTALHFDQEQDAMLNAGSDHPEKLDPGPTQKSNTNTQKENMDPNPQS